MLAMGSLFSFTINFTTSATKNYNQNQDLKLNFQSIIMTPSLFAKT